ncbi:MAG: diguanylate cyclase, partial [FCB group bacterium]|nr:diguanylate cyclase [FCB group bacterium]
MAKSNYQNIIENLYEGLFYVDKERRIKYWSKGAEKITGYSSSEVLDQICSEKFLCPTDADGRKYYGESNVFTITLANGTYKQFELLITHKNGSKVPVSIRIAPMYDVNDNIVGATQLFTDNKEHLEHLVNDSEEYENSFFDPITKLPNKVSLEMSINFKLSEFRRYNRPFGIILFEIDNYDKLSKIYGEEFDVNVLTKISKLVTIDLRPFDIAGRWSEKEFALVLINVREDSIKVIGDRLKDIIENTDLTIGKGEIDITLSIAGIVATLNDSTKLLIEKLRTTIKKCKHMGGNKFKIWSP